MMVSLLIKMEMKKPGTMNSSAHMATIRQRDAFAENQTTDFILGTLPLA